MFLTTQGHPFCPNHLSALVRRYVAAAQLGHRGACHLFRHTMATVMLEGGADIRFIQQMLAAGQPPVVLCSPQIRLGFKRFFETTFAELAVLSYAEIPPRVEVQNAGVVPAFD